MKDPCITREQAICLHDVGNDKEFVMHYRAISNTVSHFEVYRCESIQQIVIKFPYNAHSDWLKQRTLSENRARVDDGKLAFKFLHQNFDKFDPNETFPVSQINAIEMSPMSALSMAH